MKPSLNLDKDLYYIKQEAYSQVIGIDEVGRGSWAGPVAVGAYILDLNTPHIEGINDSKMLKVSKRETLSQSLSLHKHSLHLGDVKSINNLGIGKTITNLICEIIEKYNSADTFFIIDGQFAINFGKNTTKVIRGDSTYYSVAAASILAKVFRDQLMRILDMEYPNYGFETNVGYPTKEHMKALQDFGPTSIHRKSFKPIQQFIDLQ